MKSTRRLTLALLLGSAACICCACASSATVRAQRDARRTPQARPQTAAKPSAKRDSVRVLRGLASYYSDDLAGHKTSNGERYDPSDLTAAHRELPFDTMVKVIVEDTGAQVIVRINDRGPFGDKRRILDLSRAAARRLNIIGRGVVRVRAEVLELGRRNRR